MAAKVKKEQELNFSHNVGVTDIHVSETTFSWVIKNFSFCPTGFDDKLTSPIFEMTNRKNVKWQIVMDPKGSKNFNNLVLTLKLVQSDIPKISITFEFSIINKDGLPEKTASSQNSLFYRGTGKGLKILMSKGYLLKNVQKILPNDTLTIFCKIKANVDQASTSTMKVKAEPKQTAKAQVPSDQAGAVPAAMVKCHDIKTKVGCKRKVQDEVQAQLNNLITAVAAKLKIGDSSSSNTQAHLVQAGAVSAGTMTTTNTIYSPVNASYAGNMLPPMGNPAVSSVASSASQYQSDFMPSGSTKAQPANSSTPSTFGPVPQYRNDVYCRYCNYFLYNCKCKNYCSYCNSHFQYCQCTYCEFCDYHIEDCDCEYCDYCDFHTLDCICDFCDYCESHIEECDCEYCIDCDCHIEECDCDDNHCSYCDNHFDDCECVHCPDCDCHFEECECNDYRNNYFYY